jgi:hypothetical protein
MTIRHAKRPHWIIRRVYIKFLPVITFAVVGIVAIIMASAASITTSSEAESGVLSGINATVTTDPSASGGSAVRFAAAAPGPDPCTNTPSLPSIKPAITTAGVPQYSALEVSGDIQANTPGMVIDAQNIVGGITVTANNVTIRNSRINMTSYWGIRVMDGVTGTKILHNEIYSTNGAYTGVLAGDAVICANYIHGVENAITAGANTIIQANLIDKLKSDSPTAHYDGIELYSGDNSKVWGNNIMLTDPAGNWLDETGAVNVSPTWSAMQNIEVRGNWLGGGSYTVYVDDQSGLALNNVAITDNHFYGTAPNGRAAFGPLMIRHANSVSSTANNSWEDGTPLE